MGFGRQDGMHGSVLQGISIQADVVTIRYHKVISIVVVFILRVYRGVIYRSLHVIYLSWEGFVPRSVHIGGMRVIVGCHFVESCC